MARWARGPRCATCSPEPGSSAAEFTRQRTSSTRSRSGCEPSAKTKLHEIVEAPTRADAPKALEVFREEFAAKYPKALEKLEGDWSALTAFYDFPAERWRHLRTTNPIESSFARVKLRTRVTKGAGSKATALAMAYKMLVTAQERWRRFNGQELIIDALDGATFKDGVKVTDAEATMQEDKVAA